MMMMMMMLMMTMTMMITLIIKMTTMMLLLLLRTLAPSSVCMQQLSRAHAPSCRLSARLLLQSCLDGRRPAREARNN
jgi:hypothetical protein